MSRPPLVFPWPPVWQIAGAATVTYFMHPVHTAGTAADSQQQQFINALTDPRLRPSSFVIYSLIACRHTVTKNGDYRPNNDEFHFTIS